MERVRTLLRNTDTPRKWLFYGDSITHGAAHTHGWRDYCQLFEERLRFELGRRLDVVIKTAISGNTTVELLASFDWRVAQFKPDVMLLMIGMNDCSANRPQITPEVFRANLNELCDRTAAFGGLAVLQTTCPILPGSAPDREPHFDAYMQIVRDVAGARQLPLVDHTAHWRQRPGGYYDIMANQFHPNEFGHRLFNRLLWQELDQWDPASRTGQLPIA